MVRTMRGCPTTQSQSEGKDKPEINPSVPQQEEQPDATEGKDIVDYNPDVDYEGSESQNDPVAQEKKEEDPVMEYAKMDMPRSGTLHQRMEPWEMMKGI